MNLIDPKKQKKAKKYFFHKFYSETASTIVSALVLLLLLTPAPGKLQKDIFAGINSPVLLRSLYFTLLFFSLNIFTFIFSFFAGFYTEHKFGFSKQTFAKWLLDYIKSFLLSLLIGLIVVNVFYFFTGISENFWWLLTAIFIFIFSSLLQRLAPIILIPLFYRLKPLEDKKLKETLSSLAKRAKVKIIEIDTIFLGDKTKKPNAAVTGMGKTKRMLLGDTLIDKYRPGEVKAVMAHELSHSMRSHIPKLLFTDGLFTLATFYILFRIFPVISQYFKTGSLESIYSLPAVLLSAGALNFIFKPFILSLSRYFEKEADNDAFKLSQEPENFISTMASFANDYLSYADPPKFIKWFQYSHPPIRERIRRARHFIKEN